MFLTHLFSAVAFVATLVLAAGLQGWIDEAQFEAVYAPFAWLCFNVPSFVECHEEWIEVAATIRSAWLGFVLLDKVD